MAKKSNDHLVKIIQNSWKMAISEQKFEDKDSQKNITVWSLKGHARHQLCNKKNI